MISLFTWNETFLTHLPSVDEQHQRLVELINDLGELVMASEVMDGGQFSRMRDAIFDYAQTHFADEEIQMARAQLDPRHVNAHHQEHKAFIAEALELGDIDGDITPERARTLVEYLVRWLAYHILGVDQRMARQVQSIQQGMSPAQAYEEESRYLSTGTDPLLSALSGLFYVVSVRNRELRQLNQELEQRVQQRTEALEEANRQLRQISMQDDLTGLPNRRFAMVALNQLWLEIRRYGGALSVLMLDADKFKEVNDGYGHAEGDALLRALALRLRGTVRRSDIVCRLGGDEFLVICPQTARQGAADVARKILATRRPYFNGDGVECWNGALSIGVAEAVEAMETPEDLLLAADQALYRVKDQGGAGLVEV